jgi:hypothetical protein
MDESPSAMDPVHIPMLLQLNTTRNLVKENSPRYAETKKKK